MLQASVQKNYWDSAARIKIYIDGKEKILPGTPGENARILLNGKKASLETAVNNNDKIEIVEASAGKAPLVKIRDFPLKGITFTLTMNAYLYGPLFI